MITNRHSATISPLSDGVLIASVLLFQYRTHGLHGLSRSCLIPQAVIASATQAMWSESTTTAPSSSLRPTGFAETILIATILLGILCVVAVALRTWQRVRDKTFHVDDAVTWLGLVSQYMLSSENSGINNTDTQKIFNLVQYAVVAWGTTVGIGSPDSMGTIMETSNAQATYCKPSGASELSHQADFRFLWSPKHSNSGCTLIYECLSAKY